MATDADAAAMSDISVNDQPKTPPLNRFGLLGSELMNVCTTSEESDASSSYAWPRGVNTPTSESSLHQSGKASPHSSDSSVGASRLLTLDVKSGPALGKTTGRAPSAKSTAADKQAVLATRQQGIWNDRSKDVCVDVMQREMDTLLASHYNALNLSMKDPPLVIKPSRAQCQVNEFCQYGVFTGSTAVRANTILAVYGPDWIAASSQDQPYTVSINPYFCLSGKRVADALPKFKPASEAELNILCDLDPSTFQPTLNDMPSAAHLEQYQRAPKGCLIRAAPSTAVGNCYFAPYAVRVGEANIIVVRAGPQGIQPNTECLVTATRARRPLRHSAALSSAPTVLTNFPPYDFDSAQIYGPITEQEECLLTNCQKLKVELIPNGLSVAGKDAGRGLRSLNYFEPGDTVGWVWGKFLEQEQWEEIVNKNVDPTHRVGEEDFVKPAKEGFFRCIDGLPQQATGEDRIVVSEQCPMGFINHGDDSEDQRVNVEFQIPVEAYNPALSVSERFKYLEVVCIEPIVPGREILVNYEYTDQMWEDIKERRTQALMLASKHKHGSTATPGTKPNSCSTRNTSGYGLMDSSDAASSSCCDSPEVVDVTKDDPSDSSDSAGLSDGTKRRDAVVDPARLVKDKGPAKPYKCCKLKCHDHFDAAYVQRERAKFQRKSTIDRKQHSLMLLDLVDNNDKPLPQIKYWLREDGEKGARRMVCCRFWLDVFTVSTSWPKACRIIDPYKKRARDDGPCEIAISDFMDRLELDGEYLPTAEGAGRSGPEDALDEVDKLQCSKRRTGVQLPYPSKKEVYYHYRSDIIIKSGLVVAEAGSDKAEDSDIAFNGVKSSKRIQGLASLSYFKKVWKNKHRHMHIRKHLRFSKCDTCVFYREKLGRMGDRDERSKAEDRKKFAQHLLLVRTERGTYRKKRDLACTAGANCMSIIVDGADQGSYALPYFHEKSKTSDSVMGQKYHMIGVLVHGVGAYVYSAPPCLPSDTNMTIEVLQRILQEMETKRAVEDEKTGKTRRPLPKKLYLQMDNCARENKNKYILGYLSWLVQRGVFEEIELSFLPVGHTHEDVDQVFSRIAVRIKKQNIATIDEMFDLVRDAFHKYGVPTECRKIESVAMVREWITKHLGDIAGHTGREFLHFKFTKHEDGTAIQTKNLSTSEWRKYETPSGGFHLLNKDAPMGFTVDDCPPPFVPCKPRHLDRVFLGLKKYEKMIADGTFCRLTRKQLDWLWESYKICAQTVSIEFNWSNDGKLLVESADPNLESTGLTPEAAHAAQLSFALLDFDVDRAPQSGLETHKEKNERKKNKLMQENLKACTAQSIEPHCYVIIRNTSGKVTKTGQHREYWIGTVWQFSTGTLPEVHDGIVKGNYAAGTVVVQWMTPYAKTINGFSKNSTTEVGGFYMRDVRQHDSISYSVENWTDVLYCFKSMDRCEDDPRFGKLPEAIADLITRAKAGERIFPKKRTLDDPIYVASQEFSVWPEDNIGTRELPANESEDFCESSSSSKAPTTRPKRGKRSVSAQSESESESEEEESDTGSDDSSTDNSEESESEVSDSSETSSRPKKKAKSQHSKRARAPVKRATSSAKKHAASSATKRAASSATKRAASPAKPLFWVCTARHLNSWDSQSCIANGNSRAAAAACGKSRPSIADALKAQGDVALQLAASTSKRSKKL